MRLVFHVVAVAWFGLVFVGSASAAEPKASAAPKAPAAAPKAPAAAPKAPAAAPKAPAAAPRAPARKVADNRAELRAVRPVSVGDAHRLTLSYARSFQFSLTGLSRPREVNLEQSVDLTAQAQVLAVNDHGNPTKVRLVVEKGSFSTHGDRLKDELKRGEVLVFELQKGEGFVVVREQPGEPLHRDTAALFVEALPYARTALTDRRNERFFEAGRTPRKPGEAWEANSALLAALAPRSIKVDKSRLTGTMTMGGVVEVAGRPCVKLEAKMRLPKYTAEDGGIGMVTPRDFTFVDGTFDGRVACYLPTEPKRQPLKWVENWRATATGQPKNGPGQGVAAVHTTRTIELADVSN